MSCVQLFEGDFQVVVPVGGNQDSIDARSCQCPIRTCLVNCLHSYLHLHSH